MPPVTKTCRFCNHHSITLQKVKQHEVSIHHACVNCGRSMDSIEKLFEHQNGDCFSKIGFTYQLKKCDLCEKILLSFRMPMHVKYCSQQEKRFKCDECDVTFHRQYHQLRHQKNRSEKTFCSECSFVSCNKKGLFTHLKLEHKELFSGNLDDKLMGYYARREHMNRCLESQSGSVKISSKPKVYRILPKPKPGRWIVKLKRLEFSTA